MNTRRRHEYFSLGDPCRHAGSLFAQGGAGDARLKIVVLALSSFRGRIRLEVIAPGIDADFSGPGAVAPWHANGDVHGRKQYRAYNHSAYLPRRRLNVLFYSSDLIVTYVVLIAYDTEIVAEGRVVVSSSRKELRTSVILTEVQLEHVREVAQANDVLVACVLRPVGDDTAETQNIPWLELAGQMKLKVSP